MSKSHFDIVIVGGGLVGMPLAYALRNQNFKIALIDAKPLPTNLNNTDGRAIALNYSSQKILETLGLWETLASYATPIETIQVSRRGVFAKTYLRAKDLRLKTLGYVVPATILASEIAKALVKQDNITFFTPAQVENLVVHEKTADLTIKQNGHLHTLTSRLIIAADGSQSSLAKMLHINHSVHDYQQTAIVATLKMTQSNQNCAYERFTKDGVIALLPLRQNEFGVVWTADKSRAEELLALSTEDYLKELKQYVGQYWGTAVNLSARFGYPLTATEAAENIRPRFVLLGNAAHTLHPVAAQGLNLALRSVAWLAEILSEADGDVGDLFLLRRYKHQIESNQKTVQGLTHGLVELTHTVSSKTLWNVGLGLFDKVPFIKRSFMRRVAGVAGEQAKLARGVEL